jgi:hypothetical protein
MLGKLCGDTQVLTKLPTTDCYITNVINIHVPRY